MPAPSAGLTYLQGLDKFGMKPGLFRIARLLEGLGQPQLAYPCVHVAGTNGKGAAAAMIAAILQEAGYRVGLYTQPHLIRYHERIRVNGEPVSDEELDALFAAVMPLAEAVGADPTMEHPTEFEVGTAIAFQHFARAAVDVAVIEVGMGGRLDATNVIVPEAAVITPVGFDHTDRLGETIEAIAAEKAGILKAGRPLVMAPQAPQAAAAIRERAQAVGAPMVEIGWDVAWRVHRSDRTGVECDIRARRLYANLHLGLLGSHQAQNAAGAVAACEILADRGFAIDAAAIRRGLAGVQWPGRLQVVGERPLVLFDGAKNPHATPILARSLGEVLPRGVQPVFVVGVQGDKAVDSMLAHLLPLGRAAITTQARSSRLPPFPAAELAERARRHLTDVRAITPAGAALAEAVRLAGPDGAVCAWGSLYLIGELLECWQGREAGG